MTKGALYVDNAENDMERIAKFIRVYGKQIDRIHVTLDCHHLICVSHPGMWRDSAGNPPPPFTIFGSKEIKNGTWTPIFPSLRKRFTEYCEALEKSGRYPLCIWPVHCLIGSLGNSVFPVLFEALLEWETIYKNNIDFVSKGSSLYTENYSVIKAEVPDPEDSTTQLNTRLINTLIETDNLFVAGEAGSHCLKNSVEDIASGFNDDSCISKIILLEDGTSPVQSPYVDFPAIQQKFIIDMKKRGMRTAKTTDF
jgi:nicotinamidase-related amidase